MKSGIALKVPEMRKLLWGWFIAAMASLLAWFFLQEPSLSAHLAVIIWIFAGVAVIYLTKKKDLGRRLNEREKYAGAVIGLFFCVFSFFFIQVGLGNPPYSIDDFSVLLSGLTLILFSWIGYKRLLLASSLPLVSIIGFQSYDKIRMILEPVAEPLIQPVIALSVFFLRLLGVDAYGSADKIMYTAASGQPLGVPIVFDCTGVESMGTFLLASALVFYLFRDMPLNKKLMFLTVGIIGTYLANIMRVVAICMSGYYYDVGGMMQLTHIHAGWVMFTVWMFLFWYMFFRSYIKGQKVVSKLGRLKKK